MRCRLCDQFFSNYPARNFLSPTVQTDIFTAYQGVSVSARFLDHLALSLTIPSCWRLVIVRKGLVSMSARSPRSKRTCGFIV
jgi:hypothetical protein